MRFESLDLSKANDFIDAYLNLFDDEKRLFAPTRVEIEIVLEETGVIKDYRKLSFGDGHALFYACLIITKRLREASRKANRHFPVLKGKNTIEQTARELFDLKSRTYGTVIAQQCREIVERDRLPRVLK